MQFLDRVPIWVISTIEEFSFVALIDIEQHLESARILVAIGQTKTSSLPAGNIINQFGTTSVVL